MVAPSEIGNLRRRCGMKSSIDPSTPTAKRGQELPGHSERNGPTARASPRRTAPTHCRTLI